MTKPKLHLVPPATKNGTVAKAQPPTRPKNEDLCEREHLRPEDIERLIEAARGNRDTKTSEVNGARVHLTGKEYAMLELLARRRVRVPFLKRKFFSTELPSRRPNCAPHDPDIRAPVSGPASTLTTW